jgi:hypothetical protein
VIVAADATPLRTELAILTSVRATVAVGFFLDRADDRADDRGRIGRAVAEVLAAARTGRDPSGVCVGAPILSAADQRLDYRQHLADVLADLTPAAWALRPGDPAACGTSLPLPPDADTATRGGRPCNGGAEH